MIDVKEAAAKISRRNGPGALIVNADDWGCDRETTNKTADCVSRGSVSAVSAMVYMQDSERAAAIARERGIDCGLHLNFTTGYSAASVSSRLVKHQNRTSGYLRRNPFARVFYHPGLAHDFEYVVAAQIDEYRRLYGADPQRIDGHHHMQLCANVVFGKLLPAGTLVRRNFSFAPGEKSCLNLFYRMMLDKRLSRRHKLVDFLFPLEPVEETVRLERIIRLAQEFVVELETHPINPNEYDFLMHSEKLNCQAGPLATSSIPR